MTMVTLLTGAILAFSRFTALLWSARQLVAETGRLRKAHGALAGLLIAAMGALTLEWTLAIRVVGGLLAVAALAATLLEAGWTRLIPVFPLLFGLAMAAGLAFGGV